MASIIAGGDSFIYGSELADTQRTHSKSTFTALLSENFNYVCAATPGNANDSIARQTIISCEENRADNIGVIVSWTFPGRYEFNFSAIDKPWEVINHWSVESLYYKEIDELADLVEQKQQIDRKNGIANFAKNWYRYVGSSEYWEIYHTLKEIVYLQNYLKVNNIPYLFTCADSDFITSYTVQHPDATIRTLHNQIDFSNWYLFPGDKGFYQWAVANKYHIGRTHPLEHAHKDAAGLIKDKFNELVKKHLE